MSNAFDTSIAPTKEPAEIIAGNFTAWRRTDLSTDYPTASYTLTYELRGPGVPARQITLTAIADGDDYLVTIASAASADYEVADYHWSAYITRDSDSERHRVASGFIKVSADLALDSSDPRAHAEKMLALIEAAIEHRATNYQLDVLSYNLPDGPGASRDPEQLYRWRFKYRREVIQLRGRRKVEVTF